LPSEGKASEHLTPYEVVMKAYSGMSETLVELAAQHDEDSVTEEDARVFAETAYSAERALRDKIVAE
jgi:hypothetical protein